MTLLIVGLETIKRIDSIICFIEQKSTIYEDFHKKTTCNECTPWKLIESMLYNSLRYKLKMFTHNLNR